MAAITDTGTAVSSPSGTLTLAELALKVLKIITPDNITEGEATSGSTTTLLDTNNLTQAASYWDAGMVFIKSGTHAGKILTPVTFDSATDKITFSALGTAIAAGVRYAVARNIYPYSNIKSAINEALDETYIEAEDATLEGDGETLQFTLPAGVYNIKRVHTESPTDANYKPISTHWTEQGRQIKFDYGYAPYSGWMIRVVYNTKHEELTAYSNVISAEIDADWLKYKTAEKLLLWGAGAYGATSDYRIEERMNIVMERLKKLSPRTWSPDVMIHTSGTPNGRGQRWQ